MLASGDTDWDCIAASDVITCTSTAVIASLGGTSTFSFTVNVDLSATGDQVNKARRRWRRSGGARCARFDDDLCVRRHGNPRNAPPIRTRCAADLTVVKENDSDGTFGAPDVAIVLGDTFTWRLTVTNIGQGAATFINGTNILTDDLPVGPTYPPDGPS